MIGISKNFIGGDSNFVVSGGKLKSGEADLLWGEENPEKSLNVACKLQGVDVDIQIPKKWKKISKTLHKFSEPNIKFLMPESSWSSLEKHWIQQLMLIDGELPYFTEHFSKHMKMASGLCPMHINEDVMREIYRKQDNDSIKSSIKSFWSGNEFCDKIVYNFAKTITGRMLVDSGPQIITIRKDIRKSIIKSRFQGGSICSIDYTSIEPKFALWKSGKIVGERVYKDIEEQVFPDENLDRKHIKAFVLATLYGSGPSQVANVTGLDVENVRLYLQVVRNFFSTKKITEALLKERQANDGKIFSHFGRAIYTRSDKPHVLFSNYNQSSATTACLDGFCNMVDFVKEENLKILPIALIHDEIIWDVHPKYKKYIDDVAKAGQDHDKVGFKMTNKVEEF